MENPMPIKVDIATNTDLHNFPPLHKQKRVTDWAYYK